MKQGFSLVELSVVLVIMGLLTGGVVASQEVIRAAELRSVMKDKEFYINAALTFKEKYGFLPADIPNATDIWGISSACPLGTGAGAYASQPDDPKLTCNGNGDGMIATIEFHDYGQNKYQWEWNMAFHHLANAELIGHDIYNQGAYPESEINPGTWIFCSEDIQGWGFKPRLKLATSAGASAGNCNYRAKTGINSQEAWSLDMKYDDGIPSAGTMMAIPPPDGAWGWWSCTNDGWGGMWNHDVHTAYYSNSTASECLLTFDIPGI